MSQLFDMIRGARELPEGMRIAVAALCMAVIAPLVFFAWQAANSTQLAALSLSPVASAPTAPEAGVTLSEEDNPSPFAVIGTALAAAGEMVGPGIWMLWRSFLDGASYTAGGVADGIAVVGSVASEAVGNIFR
ncbi:MAG: hypothetical protein AAB539_03885 [Patescibacteria group bacterium]